MSRAPAAGEFHRHSIKTVLQLVMLKAVVLFYLLIFWHIEQEGFDWATAQDFADSITSASLHAASLPAWPVWPAVSDVANLMIALLAYIEARMSTGKIMELLRQRGR